MEASEDSEFQAIRSVATKLSISEEWVRRWRRKAQIDAGDLPGASSAEHAEIRRLKGELAEWRRTNRWPHTRWGAVAQRFMRRFWLYQVGP
jgi:transposase